MLRTKGYLRVKEAALLLGVSPNTVRAWRCWQDSRISASSKSLPDVQANRLGAIESTDRTLYLASSPQTSTVKPTQQPG